MSSPAARRRRLYAWERHLAQPIFGEAGWLGKVWVYEGYHFSNWVDDIGRWLRHSQPRAPHQHNAMALGNRCFFPIHLPVHLLPPTHPLVYQHAWLIHELVHCWQYQWMGWRYLGAAVRAQFREGSAVYQYGGAEILLQNRQMGGTLFDFHVEKQATILQHFCARQLAGYDTTAWEPYVQDACQKFASHLPPHSQS
ncbi:MAG TPA: hypothetical protein PK299_10005 [Anaerolineales bacterium]|nr:hypothetical protein [Anaerolineales bacterium]